MPQGERVTRDGDPESSVQSVCLLLGAQYWMGEMRKSPTVSEDDSKEVGAAEVWVV